MFVRGRESDVCLTSFSKHKCLFSTRATLCGEHLEVVVRNGAIELSPLPLSRRMFVTSGRLLRSSPRNIPTSDGRDGGGGFVC